MREGGGFRRGGREDVKEKQSKGEGRWGGRED